MHGRPDPKIAFLSCLLAIAVLTVMAGCITINPNGAGSAATTRATVQKTPAKTPVPVTTTAATVLATVPTAVPVTEHAITDGFWCRERYLNIGKAPTSVRECYRFFDDGTYLYGYDPGKPMGKSASCSGDPKAKCGYFITDTGLYELAGGYFFTKSGDLLIDPHDPPYFERTETGIP